MLISRRDSDVHFMIDGQQANAYLVGLLKTLPEEFLSADYFLKLYNRSVCTPESAHR